MDIVIISEFCGDFSKSDNDRFLYLAKMLAQENQVEIITSSFHHSSKKQRGKLLAEWPFKITIISEPGYPKNVCLKRFASHYVWGRNVLKYIKHREKPDVVYCAIPSLTGPKLVSKYCEKKDIKFVIDVQDLWPESFRMAFNIPLIRDCVFMPFSIIANGIYKRADEICAVSETYVERALKENQKCNLGTAVFLGTDLSTFDRYAKENPVSREYNEEFWIGYAGTLGTSYNIPFIIKAIGELNAPNVHFLVMGDGPKRQEFQAYAEKIGINATFMGRLPYEKMCGMLAACDIVVNPIQSRSVASIINKHADYAACGKAVINTQNSAEYKKLVESYQMGVNIENDDFDCLVDNLKMLISNKSLRVQMGNNARRCAEEKFNRRNTYQSLIAVIEGVNK